MSRLAGRSPSKSHIIALASMMLLISGCGSEESKKHSAQTQAVINMITSETADNQKLYEMGGCEATVASALTSDVSDLVNTAKRIMAAVDFDAISQAGYDKADMACGKPDGQITAERGACLKEKVMPYAAYIAGYSKAKGILARNGNEYQFLYDYCKKHFEY